MKTKALRVFAFALALVLSAFACMPRSHAPSRMGASSWLDQSFAPLPITTTAQYTQPAVSGTVSVAFDSTVNLAVGVAVFVVGGGYYTVASITDDANAVLTNTGATGNAAPTAVIAGGAHATVTGPAGLQSLPGQTGGSIAYFDGGVDAWVALAPGDAGQVLKVGPTWATSLPAGATGASGSRPSATGSGTFYFLSDAPIAYFDDPVSVAWKQFPFPLFTSTVPAAASYTVVGSIALAQVADAVSAITTVNTASNASVAVVAGSLGSSSTWVVTLKAEFQPAYGAQYPTIGAVVTDGTTSGTSNAYATDCASTQLGYYICHFEKSTVNGARITTSTDLELTAQYGGTAGVSYFRILADGVNAHYQLSNNGLRWTDVNVAATPSSLTSYGFLLGNPFTSTNSYGQAWVLENSLKSLSVAQATVTGATNATPIVVTTSANHNLVSGDLVAIHGVTGNTNANTSTGVGALAGAALVNVLSATTFQIAGVSGNGAYVSGGTVTLVSR